MRNFAYIYNMRGVNESKARVNHYNGLRYRTTKPIQQVKYESDQSREGNQWMWYMGQELKISAAVDILGAWEILSQSRFSVLSMESLCESVEGARVLDWILSMMLSSSRLNMVPKCEFIEFTMSSGVHSGRLHAVMVLWEPRTMNGSPPFDNSDRKFRHIGQQRFDTPITRPKPYYHKRWGSGDKIKLESK